MLEPNAKIKSGIFALALGISASFAYVGGLESSASAQSPQGLAPQGQNQISPVMQAPVGQQPGLEQNDVARKNQLLLSARRALAGGDVATTERLIGELQSLNFEYTPKEDQPAFVLALLEQYKGVVEKLRTEGQTEVNRRAYADILVRQALGLLLKGDLDTAEKLAQSAAAQQVVFSPEVVAKGLDPKSIMERIQNTRLANRSPNSFVNNTNTTVSLTVQKQLQQAQEILGKGRAALAAGQTEHAEQYCRQAASLGLPDNVYPNDSDSPLRLQSDIARARLGQIPNNAPNMAGNNPIQQVGNTVPAFVPAAGHAMNPTQLGNTVPAHYNAQNDATRVQQVRHNLPNVEGNTAPLQQYGDRAILDEVNRERLNVVDEMGNEITRDISAAYRLRNDKPEDALNLLFTTRAKVENSDLTPMQRQQYLSQVDFSINMTKRYMEQNRPQLELKEHNANVLEELKEARDNKEYIEQKVKELCEQVGQCLDEGRHQDAMYLATKANEIAPEHPTVKLLYKTTRLHHEIRTYDGIRDAKEVNFAGAMLAVDQASIPFDDRKGDLQFNLDHWNNRVKGRPNTSERLGSTRPEIEQEILRKMSMPVRIDFEEQVPLSEVLATLQALTQITIVPDHKAMLEADISPDQMIQVQLPTEISLKSALRLILGQVNLDYVVQNEVLMITTPNRAKGAMYPITYYVGDLVQAMNRFTNSRRYSLEESHNRAMNTALGRGQNASFGHGTMPVASMHPGSTLNNMVSPDVLAQLNQSMSAPSTSNMLGGMGGNGFGGASGGADFGPLIDLITAVTGDEESWDENEPMEYEANLSLVIKQTEEIHEEIADLLKQLRKLNDLQVTVEVRFITLSDSFFERMGIDFDMNFRNKSTKDKITSIDGTSSGTDSNSNSNSSSSTSSSQLSAGQMHGDKVVVGMSSPGVFNANLDVPMTMGSYESAIPNFGGFSPEAGVTMGFAILSDVEAFFFMNAAQGDARSNILQAPKITIFNGQYGSINDTSETPFVTSVYPVVGDFSVAYQPVITILNEGTNLTVQAVVTHDRQYVKMTLNPVFSKITNRSNQFRFSGDDESSTEETSSTVGDSSNPASSDTKDSGRTTTTRSSGVTIQQPVIAEVSVSTTVSVPDGGTILLGGIKRLSEGRNEAGVPILNKIPFINRLFMNTAIGRDTQSIMLMVTPRILIQEEEEQYMLGTTASY